MPTKKRGSIRQKLKEVLQPPYNNNDSNGNSNSSSNNEIAVDDDVDDNDVDNDGNADNDLEDDLFAQLDKKDDEQCQQSQQSSDQVNNVNDTSNDSSGTDKKSRKAKREEKKLQEQEYIKQKAIEESNLASNEKLTNEAKEEEKILNDICSKQNRSMFEISPDGHCLYAAIADQANLDNLLGYSIDNKATYVEMRKLAADYLRNHQQDFLPFLSTANLTPADGLDESGHEAEGLPMNEKQFKVYCDIVERTGEWGGHIELLAISRALNKPIHVVQRSTPNVLLIGGDDGEFSQNPEKEDGIWISFHTRMYGLGEVSIIFNL